MPRDFLHAPLDVVRLKSVPAAGCSAPSLLVGRASYCGDPVRRHKEQPRMPAVNDDNPVIRMALQHCQQRPHMRPDSPDSALTRCARQRHYLEEPEVAADEDGERLAETLPGVPRYRIARH